MKKDLLKIDEETLNLAKGGDLTAFSKIMTALQKAIFNHLYRLTGSPDEAADLTQETFLKLYRKIKLIDPRQNFKAWLYKIATHTAYDWFDQKNKRNEVFLADQGEAETIDTSLTYYQLEEAPSLDLEIALKKIKPAYQTVIFLYYQQGFSYEEIAKIMNLPLGTVKNLLYRAKQALANQLK